LDARTHSDAGAPWGGPAFLRLQEGNERALANRPAASPGYVFRPDRVTDGDFQALKREYPYFGFVQAEVEGVPPFLIFSNDDDRIAQRYFFFGPNAFEGHSLRLWRELARRSEHVFDVGAFTGLYSVVAALANREARVYCFEPARELFGRLLVNLKVNRLRNRMTPFPIALSDADGEDAFNAFMGWLGLPSGSSLLEEKDKEIVRRERVETRRLDTFVAEQGIPRVDLVKIDAERAETMVVGGMGGVLERDRPRLLVEVFHAEGLRELDATLSPLGYSFAVIDEERQEARVNDFGAKPDAVGTNVLFGPGPAEDLRAFCEAVRPL